MILYHGTNQDIESIDLTKGLRHKDFGMERALRFLHKTSVEIL
jgi:hypothetical protein